MKFMSAIAFSTCAFASATGKEIPDERRNDTKTNRRTAALFAASTRCNCPDSSTDSIESPGCRDKVEDAVEITASASRHATASDAGSLRSPTQSSTPHLRRFHLLARASQADQSSYLFASPREFQANLASQQAGSTNDKNHLNRPRRPKLTPIELQKWGKFCHACLIRRIEIVSSLPNEQVQGESAKL